MFGLIFSGVFLLFAALFILVGALKGKKTAWQLSVTKTVLNFISAIIAAFLASLIAWFGAGLVLDLFIDMFASTLEIDIYALMEDVPSAKGAITALAAMIIAPVLYLILYAIVRPLVAISKRSLAGLLMKYTQNKPKQEKAEQAFDAAAAEGLDEIEANRAFFASENTDTAEPAEAIEDNEIENAAEEQPAAEPDELAAMMSELDAPAEEKSEKKDKKDKFRLEKSNWISAACGAACALVTLCMLCIPAVGFADVFDDVMVAASSGFSADSEIEGSDLILTVAEISDGAANNAGSFTVKAMGGGFIYDIMTSYTVDGVGVTLRDESGLISSGAKAGMVMMGSGESDKAFKIDALEDVSDSFDDAGLVPLMLADFTAAASGDWKEGNDFHGVEMPSLGATIDPLMMSAVEAFSLSGRETIKEDFRTMMDVAVTLIEKDALENSENPLSLLSDEDTTSAVLKDLLDNPRLAVLVDGISDFGVGIMLGAVQVDDSLDGKYDEFKGELLKVSAADTAELAKRYTEVFDKYGLELGEDDANDLAMHKLTNGNAISWVERNVVSSEEQFREKTQLMTINKVTDGCGEVTDTDAESKALAKAYNKAYGLMEQMSKSSFGIDDMIAEMGPVLDAFAATESVGKDGAAKILKATLQSKTVHDEIGFTVIEASESAASINKNAKIKSYDKMLNSLVLTMDVVEAASNPNVNTNNAVNKLLDDLTPESAEVLEKVSTPGVMISNGVPEQSSAPTADLFGDTFSNLAAARDAGMSDEDYAKESSAVSNMMNVIMTSGSGPVFGDRSATGISSDQFVAELMDSTVMADTLVSKVYVNGEYTNDPLLSERSMREEEHNSFVTSLNNEWENSDKSETAQKKIISIAAIMNVEVVITADGVVEK